MLKSQVFTESGTWLNEDNVTGAYVTMVAGGGAGNWSNGFTGGGGGGAGGFCSRRLVPVSGPVDITLGAGGTPVPNGTLGISGNGDDSTFGSLRVSGGQGAWWEDSSHIYGGNGGNNGRTHWSTVLQVYGTVVNAPGATWSKSAPNDFFGGSGGGGGGRDPTPTRHGGDSANGFVGGPQGDSLVIMAGSVDGGGGGAASPWANGGDGATATEETYIDGGDAHGYGAGGAGGAGGGSNIGGRGGNGYCLVEWYAP
jgi:hypothetical protein